MSYELLNWLMTKERKRKEKEYEQTLQREVFAPLMLHREELTHVQRLERLRSAVLSELEFRLDTQRKSISNAELVKTLKDLGMSIQCPPNKTDLRLIPLFQSTYELFDSHRVAQKRVYDTFHVFLIVF